MKTGWRLTGEQGQAATEIVIVLALIGLVLAAVGGLFSLFSHAGSNKTGSVTRGFSSAAYSLGGSGLGAAEGVSDALMH